MRKDIDSAVNRWTHLLHDMKYCEPEEELSKCPCCEESSYFCKYSWEKSQIDDVWLCNELCKEHYDQWLYEVLA